MNGKPKYKEESAMSNYTMQRLGATATPDGIVFRVWAELANDVKIAVYNTSESPHKYPMTHIGGEIWEGTVKEAKNGQKYTFVIDGKREKADPRAKKVEHSDGKSIIDVEPYQWQCNDFRMPSWNDVVLYQMHLATFPDKKPAEEKQLEDAIADLWYLQKLGVNAIQLLPTAEFPGDVSCGYNPSNIYAVESHYGGPAAMKRFIDAAHSRGIAVLLDIVINHISPSGDKSLWQFTDWNEQFVVKENVGDHYEDRIGEGGGIYFFNNWRAYTPWGSRNRPDYGRKEVRDFLRDNIMMWLLEYRIDGFRFDSVVNIRNVYGNNNDPSNDVPYGWRLLQEINNSINNEGRNVITIAEDLQGNEWITKDTDSGGAGFGSQWDSTFFHVARHTLETARDEDRDMRQIRNILYGRYNGDAFRRVVSYQTHDMAAAMNNSHRLFEVIGAGHSDTSWFAKKRAVLGSALVFTAPGIPMLLQGDEILEWRQFGDQRTAHGVDWTRFCNNPMNCRDCMKSLGKCMTSTDQFCGKNISCSDCPDLPARCTPQGPFSGIAAFHRDLIDLRLRRDETLGLRGQHINVFHVNNDTKVIAYHRWHDDGGDTVVLLNFADRSYADYKIGLPREGRWKVRLNSDYSGYESSFGNHPCDDSWAESGGWDGLGYHAGFGLGPYSAIILSR